MPCQGIQLKTALLHDRRNKIRPIPAHRPAISKQELESVLNCLIEDQISQGQITRRFERSFANAINYTYALAVSSLAAAYHLAYLALGIDEKDTIIMSGLAPLQAYDGACYVAAKRRLIDVDKNCFHPSPQQIEAAVLGVLQEQEEEKSREEDRKGDRERNREEDRKGDGERNREENRERDRERNGEENRGGSEERSKEGSERSTESGNIFFLLDHTFGAPAADHCQWLRKHKVRIIEDFSGLIGCQQDDRYFGKQGDIALCGLGEQDLLTTGNGAIVFTHNANLYKKMHSLRYGGNRRERGSIAYDYRLEDFRAAMGLNQLSRLGPMLERRRLIGQRYMEVLSNTPHETYFHHPGIDTYLKFPLLINKDANEVQRYFRSLQISLIPIAEPPLHHLMGLPRLQYPGSERFYRRAVGIPIYPTLSAESVKRIVTALKGLI